MFPVAVAGAEAAWLRGDSRGCPRRHRHRSRHRDSNRGHRQRRRAPGLAAARGRSTSRRSPQLGPVRARARRATRGAAADAWTECGRPYEAALARADIGTEAALRTALSELDALGARAAATVVSHRLRRLGGRDVPRGPRRYDPRQRRRAHRPGERGAARSSPTGSATRTSRSGSSLRAARSITTSPRSCASSTRGRAARRSPRPGVSGCSKTGSAAPNLGSSADSGAALPAYRRQGQSTRRSGWRRT